MTKLRPPAHPENFRVKVGRYGDRWYIDRLLADALWTPMTDPVPSVSTVKGAWPKVLHYWAANEVSAFAVDNVESWRNLDRQAAIDLLKKAPDRSRDASASRGTSIHGVIETLAESGQMPMLDLVGLEEYQPVLESLAADLQPEFVASEVVAIKRGEDGYGGTPDAIATLDGYGCRLIDWKSRKAGKGGTAYPDEFAQCEAYRSADYLIAAGEDGEPVRVPVPATDGVAVVTIAPEAYSVCVPDDDGKLHETWTALRRFWTVARFAPVLSVKAQRQIVVADDPNNPTGTAKATGVVETVEPQPSGHRPPDPDRLAWFSTRYDAVRGRLGPDAIRAAWPAGLPTPKLRDQWRPAELDRAIKVLDRLDAESAEPFGAPDPQPAKLRRKPSPGKKVATPAEAQAAKSTFTRLPDDRRSLVLAWQSEANTVARPWTPLAKDPTLWSVTVAMAACRIAGHTDDDEIARAWVALVIGDDDAQSHPVGALLGSLTLTEAERLRALTEADTFAAAVERIDGAA